MLKVILDPLDREMCKRFGVFIQKNETSTDLWISDQTDLSAIDYIKHRIKSEITIHRVIPEIITQKLSGDSHSNDKTNEQKDQTPEIVNTNKVVSSINRIIGSCIHEIASDIHFEPNEQDLLCRARIDGILVNRERIDLTDAPEVISRLKIMAGLDIAEKRRPQDGRIRFEYQNRLVDIRVSVIPCDFGEKVVLRLLDKDSLRLDLKSLGFTPRQLDVFKDRISLPNGIILVTGPTGSGKTTTLYAALNYLRSSAVNISTVEDPIEYNLEGINQTQVKPEINLTFSAMLRALLRQDPNIIMVGEIRDRETLDIAIRASLTGHLVLSTLHTNNAVATITRLVDMGAEPTLLASSLKLIVAQRLVRKNCQSCLSSGFTEENQIALQKLEMTIANRIGENGTHESGAHDNGAQSMGCSVCNETGYKGRTAIYEVLPIDDQLKQAITQNLSEQDTIRIAKKSGYETMTDIASGLIEDRITTPLEVLRELST